MPSSVITPVGQAIQSVLASLTPSIKSYLWLPQPLGVVPAAVVELPDFSRVGVDSAESQLGTDDWNLKFPVNFYFDLRNASKAQSDAAQYVEAFVAAIDANPSLDGEVLDAKVTRAEVSYVQEQTRALLSYECDLEVLKLV